MLSVFSNGLEKGIEINLELCDSTERDGMKRMRQGSEDTRWTYWSWIMRVREAKKEASDIFNLHITLVIVYCTHHAAVDGYVLFPVDVGEWKATLRWREPATHLICRLRYWFLYYIHHAAVNGCVLSNVKVGERQRNNRRTETLGIWCEDYVGYYILCTLHGFGLLCAMQKCFNASLTCIYAHHFTMVFMLLSAPPSSNHYFITTSLCTSSESKADGYTQNIPKKRTSPTPIFHVALL